MKAGGSESVTLLTTPSAAMLEMGPKCDAAIESVVRSALEAGAQSADLLIAVGPRDGLPSTRISVPCGDLGVAALPREWLTSMATLADDDFRYAVQRLRQDAHGNLACLVRDCEGGLYLGHLRDIGARCEFELTPGSRPVGSRTLIRVMSETWPAARADVIVEAARRGVAPSDLVVVLKVKPNADASGTLQRLADAVGDVAIEINVCVRSDYTLLLRASHPDLSKRIAVEPSAGCVWVLTQGFGLVSAHQAPLVDDGSSVTVRGSG